ncbi:hypothetical protein HC251_18010 [Iamia sp. SCSIO 61187]|uniref:hypothetical protein n=1 Tax=Iamia sp. SCSIO 61187 TaxID=2722752 RepID=UPI001C624958|nr:hypothetical protein [Iamia sp. SCSIO 61187]QYG90969.1 hypothetical protein HC251_18010 [Iamia sp. SCSIO 61187]
MHPTTTTPLRRSALATIGLAALLLAGCGGGGGDDEGAATESPATEQAAAQEEAPDTTEAPTTTAAPTTTEAPTTEAPTTTAPETAAYSFDDTFDSDTGWVTGCNDVGCAGIEDSYFYEDIFAGEKEIDQHTEWEGRAFYDVTIEAGIVEFGAGTPQGGVVCHADPEADTYYDFTIGPDGRGSVYRFEGGEGEALGGPFTVEGFVPASTIVQAYCAYNEDGSLRLGMGINDETVVDVVDEDPLPPGEVGLISYGDTAELSTVHYELVTVRASELVG